MAAVLIDSGFLSHPLVRQIGKDSSALLLAGACRIAETRSADLIGHGELPLVAAMAGVSRPGAAVGRLVAVGFWSPTACADWYLTCPLVRISYKSDRPPVSLDLRMKVLERDQHTCRRCGATDDLHIDHRMPVALGGLSTFENLQVLCRPCNLAKGAMHPDVWEATR